MNIKLVAIPAIALAASLGLVACGSASVKGAAPFSAGSLLAKIWESNYMDEARTWKLVHGPMSTKQAMMESLKGAMK
jgi:ABC-type glycerol-3-phosphate transport system substrate-binding protein